MNYDTYILMCDHIFLVLTHDFLFLYVGLSLNIKNIFGVLLSYVAPLCDWTHTNTRYKMKCKQFHSIARFCLSLSLFKQNFLYIYKCQI